VISGSTTREPRVADATSACSQRGPEGDDPLLVYVAGRCGGMLVLSVVARSIEKECATTVLVVAL
jgi:hypothetical protein